LVDELHAFIGNERGKQLQSLLHRLDLAIGRFVPRIALSATLGDMRMAAEFLRPGHGEKALLLNDGDDGRELQLLLRGTLTKAPVINADKEPDDAAVYSDKYDIARYMFKVLRGKDNLIFANRRQDVEFFADLLRRHCEQVRVPNEFLPHHGSLSKELREHAEQRLKDKDKPASVVATTTLEMGIDVGSVSSIAQIGNPPSVAAMKQRLGRSGRRKGEPAIMRAFISEQEIDQRSSPQDMLRAQTVQAAAMVELMLTGWSEPPELRNLHLSTLIQQLLSAIAQLGGVRADHAWKLLCGTGPFPAVDQSDFVELLRVLGKKELLTQAGDGTLVLGVVGEQLVDHYDFYAAFFASKEFQLLHDGRSLGSLPISNPVMAGTHLIFGGRRWTVITVDIETSVILVKPSEGGRPPMFDGGAAMVHDRVREQMRMLYTSDVMPLYADATARDFIAEGRAYFRSAGLATQSFLEVGDRTYMFPWAGDRVMVTLESILCSMDLEVSNGRIVLEVKVGLKDLKQCIRTILSHDPPSANDLARNVENRILGKYDHLLSDGLQCKNYASAMFDVPTSFEMLRRMVTARKD
ncbi:MAG TPA: helicase-related protein, partial [Polyangiaceae bacterium]|nr:helicase-related protein [Polyangiaceae bacterium]